MYTALSSTHICMASTNALSGTAVYSSQYHVIEEVTNWHTDMGYNCTGHDYISYSATATALLQALLDNSCTAACCGCAWSHLARKSTVIGQRAH